MKSLKKKGIYWRDLNGVLKKKYIFKINVFTKNTLVSQFWGYAKGAEPFDRCEDVSLHCEDTAHFLFAL